MILVVDDDEDGRTVLAELLGWRGAHAIAVESVERALEVIRGARVDFVITDYAMPHVDGLTLVRTLRAIEAHVATPIVMLTGQPGAEIRRAAQELGASFMVKPADVELLLRLVDRAFAALDEAHDRRRSEG